jgi:hypothetical protein
MNDDQVSSAATREVFEAIVSQIEDPELVQVRRRIAVLAVTFFVAAAVVTIIGNMGWQTMLAFSSTFVPSVIVLWRIFGRRYPRVDAGSPPDARRHSRPRR